MKLAQNPNIPVNRSVPLKASVRPIRSEPNAYRYWFTVTKVDVHPQVPHPIAPIIMPKNVEVDSHPMEPSAIPY
jgi:hypothetical protein